MRKSKNIEIYKKALSIGLPVAFENMVYSLINFIDVFMVGKENILLGLGTVAVAGTGFANQLFIIYAVSLFGINSGAGIFASQYYGSKDYRNLKKCLGITLSIGLLLSLVFIMSRFFFPEEVIGFFTKDREVLNTGIKYFKLVIWTYPLAAVGMAFNMQLRATGNAKYSLYSSILGLLINVTFNIILIYGKLGFPAMGVEGAAIATVLARAFSTVYLIFIIYRLKLPIAGSIPEYFSFSWSFAVRILKVSLPTFCHEIMWVIGISTYVVIYGQMGTESAAAVQIVKSSSGLVFTLLYGLASAASTMIGNEIGAGNEDKAYRTATSLLKVSVIMGTVIAITIFFSSPLLLKVMGVDKNLYPIAQRIFFSETLLIIVKSAAAILIVGILRAGGDTLWTLFIELIPLWLVAIPLTYIGGLKLGLPVSVVYFLAGTDDLIKVIPCIRRMKSRKWINNLVKK